MLDTVYMYNDAIFRESHEETVIVKDTDLFTPSLSCHLVPFFNNINKLFRVLKMSYLCIIDVNLNIEFFANIVLHHKTSLNIDRFVSQMKGAKYCVNVKMFLR